MTTAAALEGTTNLDDGAGTTPSRRSSVITLTIREKAALQAAYMPFVVNGALFVPTIRPANLGDDLYLILTLMEDSTRFAIPGKVVWITPAGSTGRQQGVGIQFDGSEASLQARNKIEQLVAAMPKAGRASNTI